MATELCGLRSRTRRFLPCCTSHVNAPPDHPRAEGRSSLWVRWEEGWVLGYLSWDLLHRSLRDTLMSHLHRDSPKGRQGNGMNKTIAKDNATALIKSLVEQGKSMCDLKHGLTHGELKELHVSEVLRRFLTSQFSVGNGVIVNRDGAESHQTDIIIYDNRIIPPVVEKQGKGVYPVESVVATVSIKATLGGADILEAENAAAYLSKNVVAGYAEQFPPLHAVFGFSGGIEGLSDQEKGEVWLNQYTKHVFNICIGGRYCWARVGARRRWTLGTDCSGRYNETKRFLALLLDNTRTRGESRYRYFLDEGHQDWFSRYIRD
jgi:hypothetical protein